MCMTDQICCIFIYCNVLVNIYFAAHHVSATVVKITVSSAAFVALYAFSRGEKQCTQSGKGLNEACLALDKNISGYRTKISLP